MFLTILSKVKHVLCFTKNSNPTDEWIHSGHSPLSAGGGGVEPPTKFPKRVSLTGPQLLEGGCWERGSDFFRDGCNFHIKTN